VGKPHDGEAICESAVICEYLDDAFPQPSMRPKDLVDRSVMRIWSSDVDTYMNGICAGITYPATHRHEIMKLSPEERCKNSMTATPTRTNWLAASG
jgi:glutathione S-transferase